MKSQTNRQTRVLIVDDHALVRVGLAQLISDESDLGVCGEAEGVTEALSQAEETKPDVVVIDITLREGSWLDLVEGLKKRCPSSKMLVLSMHDESLYAERALQAGVMGYISKRMAAEKVIEGIRTVLSGKVYLSSKMTERLLLQQVDGGSPSAQRTTDKLTNRELLVLELIGQGLKTGEIAERLDRSIKTVEAHREHIKRKLNLDSASDLMRYAIQWVLEVKGGSES